MAGSLGRNEMVLFSVGLIQGFAILPAAVPPLPKPKVYLAGVGRNLSKFYLRITRTLR